jgi:hypothetical protein
MNLRNSIRRVAPWAVVLGLPGIACAICLTPAQITDGVAKVDAKTLPTDASAKCYAKFVSLIVSSLIARDAPELSVESPQEQMKQLKGSPAWQVVEIKPPKPTPPNPPAAGGGAPASSSSGGASTSAAQSTDPQRNAVKTLLQQAQDWASDGEIVLVGTESMIVIVVPGSAQVATDLKPPKDIWNQLPDLHVAYTKFDKPQGASVATVKVVADAPLSTALGVFNYDTLTVFRYRY